MASTYSDLKFELIGTGDQSGVWGTTTNDNIGTAIEQALVGLGNPIFTTDANLTISLTNTVALQTARALVLNATSSGSLTATRELVVPTIEKQYIVQNNTTGGQSITVKTTAGTGITVTNGRKAHLYVDGVNVIQMFDFVDINGGAVDGTPIGASSASTGAFTTLAASGAVTLSGGTANGVVYANGSKVLTSGTALTFDGTNFGLGTSSPIQKFVVSNGGAAGFELDPSGVDSGPYFQAYNRSTSAFVPLTSISSYFAFRVGSTPAEGMRLTSTGLGIGTSSPGVKLDVRGNATFTGNGTSRQTADFTNTGGQLYVGAESSAGGAVFVGSSAYAGIVGTNTNTPLQLGTNGTIKATLDPSGNLGLGVTPSAWQSIYRAVQAPGGSAFVGRNDGGIETITTANAYRDSGGTWKYVGTGVALRYAQDSDGHIWYNAPSGTAGNAITFTQAMTLNASGNLGIGTSSPSDKFDVGITAAAPSNSNFLGITVGPTSGSTAVGEGVGIGFRLRNTAGGALGGNSFGSAIYGIQTNTAANTGGLAFYTRADGATFSERMRIGSSGIVTMSAYGAGAATFSAAGVISSVSDETWKTKDGVPVNPDAMLKKLEPGYWYYNDEKKDIFGADRQLGFYAQNVNAAIGPEAAPEPEEGKPWGYYDRSVLAVVVMSLQKALATIESLEARIATLESKP